ncbi:MAG: RNA-binding S4 domain-containing protein [Proteobacteria bacterium]|nr:RNA-binding S4 domain-containing protein [Pseudomonadota bacterium]
MHEPSSTDRLRLDKWLWAARFYKTRSLSADEIAKGRVSVNGQPAKPSREVHAGDTIELRLGPLRRTLIVKAVSTQRGSATVAQALFEETAESVAARARLAAERHAEPALAIEQGRPTKRDRRQLADWQRWSATIEPD